MINKKNGLILISTILSFNSFASTPVTLKYTIDRAENSGDSSSLILPYLFSTETMGFNIGVGGVVQGEFQDELLLGATAYKGADSYGFSAGFWNYLIPHTERFYLSGYGFYGFFPEQVAHGGGRINPTPNEDPLPGSGQSSLNDTITGDGHSNFYDLKLEYVLPIGAHQKSATLKYKTKAGLPVGNEKSGAWNPLENGSTIAILRHFYQYQSFDNSITSDFYDGSVRGMEVGIQYDNTNFAPNPSDGSRQYLSFIKDGSVVEPEQEWSFVSFDASVYRDLGESKWASQQVLAMNFWTGYSPTWEVVDTGNDSRYVENGAPYNYGATLGGWNRMRGYDSYRFHDKAVVYSSLEYRHTFKYNPFNSYKWMDVFAIDWIQAVPFIEIGSVAPEYSINSFSDNIKVDGGLSLRMMAAGLVLRADYAVSDEGSNIWFMVNQTY